MLVVDPPGVVQEKGQEAVMCEPPVLFELIQLLGLGRIRTSGSAGRAEVSQGASESSQGTFNLSL